MILTSLLGLLQRTKPRALRHRFLSVACWSLLIGGLALGCYLLAIHSTGNIHTVVPNELYRSAQLDINELNNLVSTKNIRTIINLQGEKPGKKWYDEEKSFAERNDVRLVNFHLSAVHPIDPLRALELLSLYRSVDKPILIHCRAGSDRSGFASALYLKGIVGKPLKEAEAQLSIKYGHFALPFLGEYNMDTSFERLQPFLTAASSPVEAR